MKKYKFTMIEMLIVCGILLFLTAGLFALGNNLFKKYYIMQGKMEMLKIQNGLAAYRSSTGDYPPDYSSSTHNEDGSEASTGIWKPVYMNTGWEGYKEAKDIYNKYTPPTGSPKCLVKYVASNGWDNWGVWYWDWREDIGGVLPGEAGIEGGYICQNKIPIGGGADNGDGIDLEDIGPVDGFFGKKFMSKTDPNTGEPLFVKFIKFEEAKSRNVFRCGDAKDYDCEVDNPNDDKYSCGWHNNSPEDWEAGYNRGEMSKALYDYLCRPMKGRLKEGVPVNPKYANSKPFIEVSNKLVRPTGRPPLFQCKKIPTNDTPNNFKRYGNGLYNVTDSFELIDVWGMSYLYVSSSKEYSTPNSNNTLKPYQSFWLSDSSIGVSDAYNRDSITPFYNPGSYDLGSRGPDQRAVNWIPMDFKLSSHAGYEKKTPSGQKTYYVYGQPDEREEGFQQGFILLPSESLKLTDFDNDNINNFSENTN